MSAFASFLVVVMLLGHAPSRVEPPRTRLIRAFVVDQRLSPLRREPHLTAQVLQRLRIGRTVYIVGRSVGRDGVAFYRVVVSRRTRGWIHARAVVVPGRRGEDHRLIELIDNAPEPVERVVLSKLLIDSFRSSRLAARALLEMGRAAEIIAERATVTVGRRLSKLCLASQQAALREYYLSDRALDRYSKLGLRFDFDAAALRYVYDGAAYRVIVKRFPSSEEASAARKRLEEIDKRTTGNAQ